MIENQRQQCVNNKTIKITCIVPVHDEEESIDQFLRQLRKKLNGLTQQGDIIVVDDGSQDATLQQLKQATHHIKIISFSRNFGKEAALTAGLIHATGDVVVLIDADFQHPLDVIDEFIKKWAEGFDMVYGVRISREDETAVKRFTSRIFYRLMSLITKVKIPPHAGDFRLMDRKVVNAMNQLPERERFMKGLYAWVGFSSSAVPFTVQVRQSGKSSWRYRNLIELALVGITSFSNIPLRFWSFLGFVVSFIAFIYGLIIVLDTMVFGVDVPGYATIVAAIMFFGGVQLLSVGILGEYIARIFNEVKSRPSYIISEILGFDDE